MSVTRSSIGVWAMSLIELLCVMAIIALLAALLLPAVGQAKTRARRIQCIDHLHQVGVGFVSFANEHNGHFPMAVPTSAGGTLEFARNGYLLQGDFHFSFRHFQALSNELVTPKLVVCPADTRLPAGSFATLSNGNLSYFIGVNAQFARPTSILAGDRNLTNDYTVPGTLTRLGPNHVLRWTDELHRFKGNLLFSDGHAEERSHPALVSAVGQAPGIATLALPTVRQPASTASSAGDRFPPGAMAPCPKPGTETVSVFGHAIAPTPKPRQMPAGGGVAEETHPPPKAESRSTNAVTAPTPPKPEEQEATLSPFAIWLAAVTGALINKGMWWLYGLLLLLVAVTFFLGKLTQGRNKRTPKPPRDFDNTPAP